MESVQTNCRATFGGNAVRNGVRRELFPCSLRKTPREQLHRILSRRFSISTQIATSVAEGVGMASQWITSQGPGTAPDDADTTANQKPEGLS